MQTEGNLTLFPHTASRFWKFNARDCAKGLFAIRRAHGPEVANQAWREYRIEFYEHLTANKVPPAVRDLIWREHRDDVAAWGLRYNAAAKGRGRT